ncbi:hypothetical protein [Salsuginibacillus kocurii]|uniref:hypothetical protein n=1 Tax=Salsuginibacillus kocurii TaxID=427078 RepID=UPI0003819788|nr:hypothetical protein [Salsuginibacillus kocurii]
MFEIVLLIILGLAIIGSIAAWLNTKFIIEELAIIKKELGINDKKKHTESFDDDSVQ